jgi:deoxyribodipyrimidine photolyase
VTALLRFTRDLRVHDHPALHAALAGHEHVIPVFCLDRLLHGRHASGPRSQFMLECLTDLDGALRDRGGARWSSGSAARANCPPWQGNRELVPSTAAPTPRRSRALAKTGCGRRSTAPG